MTNTLNPANQGLYAPGYPAYDFLSRAGVGWSVQTATLFAPLTAVPTTTAALEVWNNPTSGVGLDVDSLFADQILSTAATQTYAIYACVSTPKAAPSSTALTLNSLSGRSLVTPTATSRIVTGVNTTVVANGWTPFGPVQAWGTAAATPGNSWEAPVNGRLLVPPGCSLLVHVVGSLATASTFQAGARYHEVSPTGIIT